MTLKSFYGKYVTIIDTDGRAYIGLVDDYFFSEDNENREESIILKTVDSDLIEFIHSQIEKIDVI